MKKLFTIFLIQMFSSIIQAQNLETVADSLMVRDNIPELGFAVISADSIMELYVSGYHRSDLKNEQTKARLSDYFHLGSNTKAITGFVAAYLVENKKIKWTTNFFHLFPEWKRDSDTAYYNITLADLLSHRAKIQPYTSGLEYQELPRFQGNKSEQRKQFAKYLLREKPLNDTTEIYHYSNAGYSIAALMLEKVSGKTWEELIKETMTKQLGLSIVFDFPNRFNTDQPYGHWIEHDTLRALPPNIDYNLALAEPAGDISMTLPDYSKFIQLNLQGIEGKNNLLTSETYNFLHYGFPDYAIGWANYTKDGKQLSQHSGSAGTFYCYTLLDKIKKLAYIVITNSATDETKKDILELSKYMQLKYSP
ncbi:MAG: serine hydrolase domain-containing protein [Chitinophagaceae bacterium]